MLCAVSWLVFGAFGRPLGTTNPNKSGNKCCLMASSITIPLMLCVACALTKLPQSVHNAGLLRAGVRHPSGPFCPYLFDLWPLTLDACVPSSGAQQLRLACEMWFFAA